MATLVQESKLVSSQDSKSIKGRSKFDLSHHHFTTLPYGKVIPFFNMETVNGDDINFRSQHSLNTFTLKSPILSNIKMRKDYFNVPMEAILPFNWQKIITNPVFGDDINATYAGCVFDITNLTRTYSSNTFESIFNTLTTEGSFHNPAFFNLLTVFELLFSEGSLAARCGINLSKLITITNKVTNEEVASGIDAVVDDIYSNLKEGSYTIKYHQLTKQTLLVYTKDVKTLSDKRDLHDFITTHSIASITYYDEAQKQDVQELFKDTAVKSKYSITILGVPETNLNKYLNISSLAAYQIAYSHYMTNDKVDNIYSADLYRQMMSGFLTTLFAPMNPITTLNGVPTPYDYLSGFYINKAFNEVLTRLSGSKTNDSISDNLLAGSMGYIINLFGMRRSLRYLDYFTGSKTHPLALGDTSVDVADGKVDVVDITKGISMQRFLNFVNRTGRKFEEYISKLGGTYVKPDYHNPQYLGSTTESLYNPTVENTGAMQFEAKNSITSTLRGESEKFAFSFESDRPSILIGVVSFDIVRSYAFNIRRDAMHIDRFDYFNEFLQNIGDQEVKASEYMALPSNMLETRVFGYQTRHAEYKSEVSRADSGFIDGSLPSWTFLNRYVPAEASKAVIDSDKIRSIPTEVDEFYLALPGVSDSSYFHFIVDFYNIVNASRPMIANPNIL